MKGLRLAASAATLALVAACSPATPTQPAPGPSASGGAPTAPAASVTIVIGTPSARTGTPTASAAPTRPTDAETAAAQAVLARHGLGGKTVEEVIAALEASGDQRPLPLQAIVKPWVLELSDAQGAGSLPLPADRFYLALAPVKNSNPECTAHNLSADQGDRPNMAFHVVIADANNTPLVDADVTTGPNGFVGFWLPRDRKGLITGTVEGAAGQIAYSTGDRSATCRNQLYLQPYRR